MCGITAVITRKGIPLPERSELVRLSARLHHRGPDWSGIKIPSESVALCHERLAIVGIHSGAQPFEHQGPKDEDSGVSRSVFLAVNGEIYNYSHLQSELLPEFPYQTDSDCEVIIPLYLEHGPGDCLGYLDGQYSFVLYDRARDLVTIARDPIGITSLYYGFDLEGRLWVSSEMKTMSNCVQISQFPAGHIITGTPEELTAEHILSPKAHAFILQLLPCWEVMAIVPPDLTILRDLLEQAVVKRLMCNVPYGVLLSGGLDSSLIASIAARHCAKRIVGSDADLSMMRSKAVQSHHSAWWPRLHTFSIGLEGSPDLKWAQVVAKHIDSEHHEFRYTTREGLDALEKVISTLETYDITTVRASIPQYLLARKIKAMGIKMVLSGEGSDEIFGGYLYFHKAPNAQEFHRETCEKVRKLWSFDCLRTHKSMLGWGVEARVPFLDEAFLRYAMVLDPESKMCRDPATGEPRIEKWLLRQAFAEGDYLPDEVLWREKEQFSDGVGHGWIDSIKSYAEAHVRDEAMAMASTRFPRNTPETKEAYLYRSIFERHFGTAGLDTIIWERSIACSTAKALEWDQKFKEFADPSGRAVGMAENTNTGTIESANTEETV